jgi:hypothetical protein
MTKEIDDGGPAFACAAENGHQEGMSLRDWYAGMALHNPAVTEHVILRHPKLMAEKAYEIADAMIAARKS